MRSHRFAIYSRISRDRVGAGLGVERQQEDCQRLVAQLGGTVVATYSDNDISAYSGKYRPGYQALLDAIQTGEIDAVAVWHQDRILRRTIDLEHYIDVCQPMKIATHTVKAGYFDLTTPAGRATAKTLAAWASYEVETSTDRVKAAKLQAAQSGLPSGGNRPYGYEQNGLDIIESEAAVVVEIIERYIAGESWRQIAFDLNKRSIPTAKGNMWSAINVRNVAVRPRNVGIRTHNGNHYPAAWTALVDQDLWDDLQLAIRRGQALNGNRSTVRKHLLKGFVYCGACGCRMNIVGAQQRDGSYKPSFTCRKKDHRGEIVGCGSVKRLKAPIEHLVTQAIMYRLETPDLGAILSQDEQSSAKLRQLMHDLEQQQLRVQEVLSAYSTGDMTMDEWKVAKATAQKRLKELEQQVNQHAVRATAVNVPAGKTLSEAWEEGGLDWRRQLVDTLIEKIEILPRPKGSKPVRYEQWWFNPDLIRLTWIV